MWTSAALDLWQPGIDSAPGTSWYAVGPSASVFEDAWFVLPAQRPASPEIAESPTATTDGASSTTPGGSRITCACAAATGSASRAARAKNKARIQDLLITGSRHPTRTRLAKAWKDLAP